MDKYLCLRDAQDAEKLKMQAITIMLHIQSIIYTHIANPAVKNGIEKRVPEGINLHLP
jgi:hypothetical protein